MNIAHWLRQAAQLTPSAPALFEGTRLWADFAGFAAQAAAIGGALAAQGIGPGDRVGIFSPNRVEYLPILFGIWWAGAAAVPINAKLHPQEVAFIVQDAGIRAMFGARGEGEWGNDWPDCRFIDINSDDWGMILNHTPLAGPQPRAPEDLAWLFYTSGTTGAPKGVIITHRMLVTMGLCYTADVDSVGAGDAALYAAPMSHGAGLYALMHVRAGARHVVPPSQGFDPGEILDLAQHFDRVHLFAAPTMVKRLTQGAKATGRSGRGLRTVVYAGGPMYRADIIDAVAHFGPIFVQIYGQGECPMGITALPRAVVADRDSPGWEARLGSVGRAQSAIELRIVDAGGAPVPPGNTGEITVRGDTVMPGYWRNPKASAAALQGGWLHTGDMGRLDDQGFLTLTDRSKDVIITGGSNVYPREVEEVLLRHPQVSQVSVVGRPHADWGEEIVAFVVGPAPDADLDQLCLDHIARFKRPKVYVHLQELPKNNYGKVLKTKLREMAAKGQMG